MWLQLFFIEKKKKIDTPYLTWNSPLVVTFSWFRKSRISDSVAVPPLFILAIDVLLRAVCARSASTSRCMTASRLFWKVWILGKTSSSLVCHRSACKMRLLHRSDSLVTSRRMARFSSLKLRCEFESEVEPGEALSEIPKPYINDEFLFKNPVVYLLLKKINIF